MFKLVEKRKKRKKEQKSNLALNLKKEMFQL